MSFYGRLEGSEKAGEFLGKFKERIANDLVRHLARVSIKFVANARRYLNKREGGYDTGTLSRSIAYQISGNKFGTLQSEIGPIGTPKGSQVNQFVGAVRGSESNFYIAELIEGGFNMKPHFVPFHKYPRFDAWAASKRIKIPAKGGGLMIRGNSGKMSGGRFAGRQFMKRGYEDTLPYVNQSWQEMVMKWRMGWVK